MKMTSNFYEKYEGFLELSKERANKIRKKLKEYIGPVNIYPEACADVTFQFHTPILRCACFRQSVRKVATVSKSNTYFGKLWKPTQTISKVQYVPKDKVEEIIKEPEPNFRHITVTERKLKRQDAIAENKQSAEDTLGEKKRKKSETEARMPILDFKIGKKDDEKAKRKEKAIKALRYIREISQFRRQIIRGIKNSPKIQPDEKDKPQIKQQFSLSPDRSERSPNSTLTNSPELEQKIQGSSVKQVEVRKTVIEKTSFNLKLQTLPPKQQRKDHTILEKKPPIMPRDKKQKKRRGTTQSTFEANLEELAYGPLIK